MDSHFSNASTSTKTPVLAAAARLGWGANEVAERHRRVLPKGRREGSKLSCFSRPHCPRRVLRP